MRIAIVIPHIFMHRDILPEVIFAPGQLALDLAHGLGKLSHAVTLFTPGPVETSAKNVTADLTGFENELQQRGYGYVELLKKHPLTFITLARQLQNELVAKAYEMAGQGDFDIVHVYTNEEESALAFAKFCKVPIVFTHHEPFNFLAKYRANFYKYKELNWLSISLSQRKSMPTDTNWVGNIYHGIDKLRFKPVTLHPSPETYLSYFGRIIEPKGVHLAIAAAQKAGVKLKIAGKHYAGHSKDRYWEQQIRPHIDGKQVEYVGFLKTDDQKQEFLGNATALLVPSTWEEPFGMVMIESLACGTPVIGLGNGAIAEVIQNGLSGLIIERATPTSRLTSAIAQAISQIGQIDRKACRKEFEKRFTLERMCEEHIRVYEKLTADRIASQ